MELSQCENCGEKVDPGKAFCPGCGQPLVAEESRADVSEFDASGKTVQFGQTVYNKMLSEMGLNISDTPNRKSAPSVTVRPESVPPTVTAPKRERKNTNRSKGNVVLLVVGALAAFFFLLAAGAVLVLLYFYLSGRISIPT